MRLREIAHARAGDKGPIVQISLIARDPEDFDLLRRAVGAEAVRDYLGLAAETERYELPRLGALSFVLRKGHTGDVTRSLALDAHGKCLSSILLDMEIAAGPGEAIRR